MTAARSVLEHRFGTSPPYTVGVEEEYMLLDPRSWDLVAGVDSLLAAVSGGPFAELIKSELLQSVLEVTTPVCSDPSRVGVELRLLRSHVSELAAAAGYCFASAGTHPFGLFEKQLITAEDRYLAMVDEYEYIARQQLVFGLHIHVAVEDPERAIQVVDGLLVHIAEFVALSASSPFWRGEPTGLRSCRQMILSALPRTGMPPRLANYAEYAEIVGALEESGCIPDYTRIWWDIRPHPRFGTVELRVCDAVTRVEDVVSITAYVQALVKLLCERVETGHSIESYHRILTTENKWLAARYGLEAPVIDLGEGRAGRVPIRSLIERTLAELEPHARELGSDRELEGIRTILGGGNGSDAQLRVWEHDHDASAVVRSLAEESSRRLEGAAG